MSILFYLPVFFFICVSADFISVNVSNICLSVYLQFFLSVNVSICQYSDDSICLSAFLPTRLFVCLSDVYRSCQYYAIPFSICRFSFLSVCSIVVDLSVVFLFIICLKCLYVYFSIHLMSNSISVNVSIFSFYQGLETVPCVSVVP